MKSEVKEYVVLYYVVHRRRSFTVYSRTFSCMISTKSCIVHVYYTTLFFRFSFRFASSYFRISCSSSSYHAFRASIIC